MRTERTYIQGLVADALLRLADATDALDDAQRSNLEGTGCPRDPREDEDGSPSPLSLAIADITLALVDLKEARDMNNARPFAVSRPVVRSTGWPDRLALAEQHSLESQPEGLASWTGDLDVDTARALVADVHSVMPDGDAKDSLQFALEWKDLHSGERYDLQATLDQLARALVFGHSMPTDQARLVHRAAAMIMGVTL